VPALPCACALIVESSAAITIVPLIRLLLRILSDDLFSLNPLSQR
jgi:hypothetical protein